MKTKLFKTATALLAMTLGMFPVSAQETPPAMPQDHGGGPGGNTETVTSWDAVKTYEEDATEDGGTYDSQGDAENAIHVAGGSVIFNQPTITRSSSSAQGGDSSSFYGVGAAVLTTNGTSYINGGTITTDANGAAGAFAYGEETSYLADTLIHTSGNTAGGIHVAGGGTLYAYDVSATTQGNSSAAIRSDRGGGAMVIDGGTYTANGEGSPAVYVTADISIHHASLTANGSEGICLEGLNIVRLFQSDLSSNMQDLEQNDHTWSVIVYQSMSGDSQVGVGQFYMIDGSLTSHNGGLFYTTNTESNFYLQKVTITPSSDNDYFLRVSGNNNQRGWGTSGANGADTNFTAVQQSMQGDVIYDSISNLDFYMQDGSVLTGAIVDDETYAGNGGDGHANIYIDSSSRWVVNGDSTVTNLYQAGTIVDADGKTVSIVGAEGTSYVQGDSTYQVIVNGAYDTTANFDNALTAESWDTYAIARPDALSTSASPSASASAETAAAEKNTNMHAYIFGVAAIVVIAAVVLFFQNRKK